MTKIVGWRPFPWHCHNCDNPYVRITPRNKEEDPQEIMVECPDCGAVWFTSGEPYECICFKERKIIILGTI